MAKDATARKTHAQNGKAAHEQTHAGAKSLVREKRPKATKPA